MEAVRPKVDAYVFEKLQKETFRASDFSETVQGACRLMPSLTHLLAGTASRWATEIAPIAEQVAEMLANAPGSRIRRLSTPLTQTNRSLGRNDNQRKPNHKRWNMATVSSVCRICGQELVDRNRSYCDTCSKERRVEVVASFARSGPRALARMRSEGRDPAHGGAAARTRATTISKRNEEVVSWDRVHPRPDPEVFTRDVLPRLQGIPLRVIMEATGLSKRYCALIRLGQQVPHCRHWAALASLGQSTLVERKSAGETT